MCSIVVILLLAFVLPAHAQELGNLPDKSFDSMGDKLFSRALRASTFHHVGLRNTTLRKPGNFAKPLSRGRPVFSSTRLSSMQSAEEFAVAAKLALTKVSSDAMPLFVCGNEAGDLDTIVSALAGAYSLGSSSKLAVPLIPFPRSEFRLRGDARMIFQDAGFQMDAEGAPTALTFWDEVNWSDIEAKGGARVMLTDHNKMSKALATRFKTVAAIVDHHSDEGLYPNATRKIDTSCGSCCSLVAEEMGVDKIPSDLGVLLLATIAVDTRNFQPSKTGKRDMQQAKKLQAFVNNLVGVPSTSDPGAWLSTRLLDARFDTSMFDANDLLKLDYKEAEIADPSMRIGFSTILGTVEDFISRAGGAKNLHDTMRDYAQSKDLSILLAMTSPSSFKGKESKGLVVVAHGGTQSERVLSWILKHISRVPDGLPESLKDEAIFVQQGVSNDGFGLTTWHVRSGTLQTFRFKKAVTRKTIMPTVCEFFKTAAKKSPPQLLVPKGEDVD